jgi:hypothetical protein
MVSVPARVQLVAASSRRASRGRAVPGRRGANLRLLPDAEGSSPRYRTDFYKLVVAAALGPADRPRPAEAMACWYDRVADHAEIKRTVLAAVETGV